MKPSLRASQPLFFFSRDAARSSVHMVIVLCSLIAGFAHGQGGGGGELRFVEPCADQSLCITDIGVSWPDDSPFITGKLDSTSVTGHYHVSQSRTVESLCGDTIWYEVRLYPFDADTFIVLMALTPLMTGDSNRAVLSFDTRASTLPEIARKGLPYNDPLNCEDAHRIVWLVTDKCGNEEVCSSHVRLTDCQAPHGGCVTEPHILAIPYSCQVVVNAQALAWDAFDDYALTGPMLFSFSPDTHMPTKVYDCEDYPAYSTVLPLDMWVADAGTDEDCDGVIDWSERSVSHCVAAIVFVNNLCKCCPNYAFEISGHVLTWKDAPVRDVRIALSSPGHGLPAAITDEDGRIHASLYPLTDLEIRASRDDDHRNGVSTLDLVAMQKHMLGIDTFYSPYQYAAADINASGSFSMIDMVQLRKLILRKYMTFPENTSWRFFNKAYPTDPNLDFLRAEAAEMIVIPNFAGPVSGADFVAVKVGDVNFSATGRAAGTQPLEVRSVVRWAADDMTLAAGEMVHVPIRALDAMTLEGCQFTLDWKDLAFAGGEPGVFALSEDDLGIFEDNLTVSWYDVEGVRLQPGDVLFTLVFRATERGRLADMLRLSSRLTEAEAYTPEGDVLGLSLDIGMPSDKLLLFSSQPNPVSDFTDIRFSLPASGRVSLAVTDMAGRIILDQDFDGVAGMNVIRLDRGDLPAAGALAFTLRAGGEQATGRIVLVN